MTRNRQQIWTSISLFDIYLEYGGNSIVNRSNMLNDILNSVTNLVILTAQGYAQIVLFRDNMTKYDDDDENDLEIALRKVANSVSKESSEFQYSIHAYKMRLPKNAAVSETLLKLLSKISPKLNEDSLTSLLIGNMITGTITKHPTPLQIALGLLIKTKKNFFTTCLITLSLATTIKSNASRQMVRIALASEINWNCASIRLILSITHELV